MSTSMPLRCKCRQQATTSLRCSRCNVPICPDCSRPAPVGMLCRGCARGTPTRLTQISAGSLGLAILVCLAVGALGGWILASLGAGYGLFGVIWGGLLQGLAVAEVALRVTGRKRGPIMEALAGGSAGAGIVAGWFLDQLTHRSPNLPEEFAEMMPNVHAPAAHFQNPISYLLIGVAVVVAVGRIRNI